MAISEQQIVEIFKTLGARFTNVHHPNIQTFWTGLVGDINNLTSELIGADVQFVENLVQHELQPIIQHAIQVISETGPKLTAHAAKLEGDFRLS